MKMLMLVLTLLLSGVALSACKFESMRMFDNNCSGNGGLRYEPHCKNFGT